MKKIILKLLTLVLIIFNSCGCSKQLKPSIENPVTLTMWHVYGSQTKSPLNDAIDKFNSTVGKENGIIINVVSVTSSSAIDEALASAAKHEPGAENLPDLFTAYPRVASIVGEDNLLSWNNYFSDDELEPFVDEFLEEGYFKDNLLMLPIAKSSEALYLNKTLFDKFSEETSITTEHLNNFESLFTVAQKYYDWTGGIDFMQINDFYNYSYVGMKAYKSNFIENGQLQLDNESFKKIWRPLASAAIYGGICLEDGYAAARWKTVEIICNTGSTADILYQPDCVIYEDNSSEKITAISLPYPKFTNDSFGAVHRGGGLFAVKSKNEQKNYAAYIFAKWITEYHNNLDFVTNAGYIPVTNQAYQTLFEDITVVKNESYRNLYETVTSMKNSYELYTLPLYNDASNIQLTFEKNVKVVLKSAHNEYIKRTNSGEDKEIVLNELVDSSLAELISLTYTQ